MGSGASTGGAPTFDDIGKWSKEEVGEHVAAIGGAFEKYREIAIANDIDGETLMDIEDDDLAELVTSNIHRKKILKRISALKSGEDGANPASSDKPGPGQLTSLDGTAAGATTAMRRYSRSESAKLFMSYPRGESTTPFARWLKQKLEADGYTVWMDEEGIAGAADFMSAIGDAIKSSQGLIAIIDEKFCRSTYCNNEMACCNS